MGRRRIKRLNERREEAKERKVEREKRTPEQQLKLLDEKLGEGNGAQKERARLQKQIEDKNAKQVS